MERTCGNCQEVNFDPTSRWRIAGCKLTGNVIPHYCDHQEQKLTFWRVPVECPRLDSDVEKSEVKASDDLWVIKRFSDFKSTINEQKEA